MYLHIRLQFLDRKLFHFGSVIIFYSTTILINIFVIILVDYSKSHFYIVIITVDPKMITRVVQDPSSVYFIHLSNSSTNQLVFVKFNGECFHNLKRSMMLTLLAKNKLNFVNGTINPPNSYRITNYG